MKKILIIAAALFLACQCTKSYSDSTSDVSRTSVTVRAGLLTTRSIVHSGGSTSWLNGDSLYVAGSQSGLLGALSYSPSSGADVFKGVVNAWQSGETLRFYYLGEDVALTLGADIFHIDLSEQDGYLGNISKHGQIISGSMTAPAIGTQNLGSVTMDNLLSIGWFDLLSKSHFSAGSDAYLTGAYATADLDLKTGVIGNQAVPQAGIWLTGLSSNYYIALIPGTTVATFTQGSRSYAMNPSGTILPGKLYMSAESTAVVVPVQAILGTSISTLANADTKW